MRLICMVICLTGGCLRSDAPYSWKENDAPERKDSQMVWE